MSSTESQRIGRLRWGDEVQAEIYGSQASADYADPAGASVRAMDEDPQPLDLGPFGRGSGSTLFAQLIPGLTLPGPGMLDEDTRDEVAPEGDGATEGDVFSIPTPFGSIDIPTPRNLGRRLGIGTLAVLLIVVGVLALIFARTTVIQEGGSP